MKSFYCAFDGLKLFFREEAHAKIHVVSAIGVVIGAWVFNLSLQEFSIVVLCIGLVFLAEITNTAIEKLCDVVQPNQDERIKKIKDLAAASVLVSSLFATIVALAIFLPRMWLALQIIILKLETEFNIGF